MTIKRAIYSLIQEKIENFFVPFLLFGSSQFWFIYNFPHTIQVATMKFVHVTFSFALQNFQVT